MSTGHTKGKKKRSKGRATKKIAAEDKQELAAEDKEELTAEDKEELTAEGSISATEIETTPAWISMNLHFMVRIFWCTPV